MNIKCGTDIIEVERIKKAIEKLGDKFLNEVYTKNEIQYCKSKNIKKGMPCIIFVMRFDNERINNGGKVN